MKIPKFYDLMTPVLRAIEKLGGAANIQELAEEVINVLCPSETTLSALKAPGRIHPSKIECKIAYASKYLCFYGVLEQNEDDTWMVTDKHELGMVVTHDDIIKFALEK